LWTAVTYVLYHSVVIVMQYLKMWGITDTHLLMQFYHCKWCWVCVPNITFHFYWCPLKI